MMQRSAPSSKFPISIYYAGTQIKPFYEGSYNYIQYNQFVNFVGIIGKIINSGAVNNVSVSVKSRLFS